MPVVTIGTTPEVLAQRNPYRVSLMVENRSTTAIIYLDTMPADGLTASNAAVRLQPGEILEILELEDGDIVYDEWSCLSDTALTTVAWKEGIRMPRQGQESKKP